MVVRSAITKMTGARIGKAIGDDRVGPARGKRDDSKATVARSAITKKAEARKSKAIGDGRVGPAGRIPGPRRPHVLVPPAAEVEGVEPMRDLGLI